MHRRRLMPAVFAALLLLGCARASAVPPPISSTSVAQPTPSMSTTSASASNTGKATSIPAFTTLHMLDANHGWGVADHEVFRTADGGRSWAQVLSLATGAGGQVVTGFYSPKDAWAAASANAGALIVDRTTDGGKTWRQGTVTVLHLIPRFVTFADPEHGWLWASHGAAMGSEAGVLLASTDGGAHWTPVADAAADGSGSIPFTGIKGGVLFTSPLDGWLVRRDPAPGAVLLYATHDGGKSWTPRPLPPPGKGWNVSYVETPVVSGAVLLLASQWVAVDQRNTPNPFQWVFYTSHDGGRTWSPMDPTPQYLGTVAFLNPLDGVAVRSAKFETTDDGGLTWHRIAPSQAFLLGDVQLDFVSQAVGFVLLRQHAVPWQKQPGDKLFATHDGGLTWTLVAAR